ncbi:MAG: IS3 family transposase [Candidatus Thiodiazotropha sp. (ex Epidulcina cf. delphinae)]|nr:IS3 family transposase [Candidatus Thiodiazotropha sp. (ex Epidulcina cf. delphinae)]
MIAQEDRLPLTRQCQLLSLNRSTVYYQHAPVSDEELTWMRRIDEMHLKRPFYGSRRIRDWLQDEGHAVNRKRIQRLMRLMGIAALLPRNAYPSTAFLALETHLADAWMSAPSSASPNH